MLSMIALIMAKVMVFGSFDPLHLGHLNYFEQAKKEGDYLVVVVARDETIWNGKKRKPFQNENKRLENVKKIKIVDKALLGNREDKFKIIGEENPEVLCLGYDQAVDEEKLNEYLKELGIAPTIKRMKPFKPEKYKSYLFRNKIQ